MANSLQAHCLLDCDDYDDDVNDDDDDVATSRSRASLSTMPHAHALIHTVGAKKKWPTKAQWDSGGTHHRPLLSSPTWLPALLVFSLRGAGRGVEEKRKSGVPEKRGKGNNARGIWGIDAR